MGFGFLEFLQTVTTVHYSAVANSRTLQMNTACTKPSQSAVSSPVVALVTGANTVHFSAPVLAV
jgi:hypothetical protein